MGRLDWDEDEVKTRLRGKGSLRGGRIRILGLAAIELPAEVPPEEDPHANSIARRCRALPPPPRPEVVDDDSTATQPIHRVSLEDARDLLSDWTTEEHMSVLLEPAEVSDAGAPPHQVEVCALVPVQSRPNRIDVNLDLDDFLEDWEVDITEPVSSDAATRPRGSLAAGLPQSTFLLDISSRHAPFEVWPDEDAAASALKIARETTERRRLEEDDAPLGLAPDSWVSAPQKPARIGTLTPTVGPRRERRTGGWLALTLLLAMAIAGTWYLWPRDGALRVELAEQESVPEVDVFVDGVRRCESTPCIVRGLSPGNHLVKLVAHGRPSPPSGEFAVRAGEETLVALSLADGAQGVALSSPQPGVRVSVDGKERGALPITLDDLASGEHHLRFSADGHRTLDKRIEVVAGELESLDVKLEALPPRLHLEITPQDASVELRRRGAKERTTHLGGWPKTLELERGEWELVASRQGYLPTAQKVDLSEGQRTLRITLAPTLPADGDIYWR